MSEFQLGMSPLMWATASKCQAFSCGVGCGPARDKIGPLELPIIFALRKLVVGHMI